MGKMEMRMALLESANNDENKQLVEGYAAVFNLNKKSSPMIYWAARK